MIFLVINGVLSLVSANPANPIVGFLNAITMPPCRYLVRKYPKLLVRNQNGYFDMSPVVLILGIGCLMIVIQTVAAHLGVYV